LFRPFSLPFSFRIFLFQQSVYGRYHLCLEVGPQFRVIFQEYAAFLIVSYDDIFFKFGKTFRKRYLPVFLPVFGYGFSDKRF